MIADTQINGRYLNLGCGYRYHPGWVNIDFVSTGPGVIAHNLSEGVPLADASCDVVYHSHALEHFRRPDALFFLRECHRVLKPSGILRVVVPDLERNCRTYLEKLDAVLAGEQGSAADYEWVMLEMYDQAVREWSGGGMLEYLRSPFLTNEDFVYERIGEEGRNILSAVRRKNAETTKAPASRVLSPRRLGALLRGALRRLLLDKEDLRALDIGRFRLSGEVHQWMYDRYSLAELLRSAGFQSPALQSATTSSIPGWMSFNLDTLPSGATIRPDSLFVETTKQ